MKSAALNNDTALGLYVEIDGIVIPKTMIHRLASPDCFNLAAGVSAQQNPVEVWPAAADGYWVMLKPLPKGEHRVVFSAQYNRPDGAFGQMAQDIEYELRIE